MPDWCIKSVFGRNICRLFLTLFKRRAESGPCSQFASYKPNLVADAPPKGGALPQELLCW